MPNLPYIYLIHAADAPQHLGKLEEILQKLKTENRIAGFTTVSTDDHLASLIEQVKDGDKVLILLTKKLEPRKAEVESLLRELIANHPKTKIVEILIDHVPYVNEFITIPYGLKPIRDRQDIVEVWNDIEQNLKDMLPAQVKPTPIPDPEPTPVPESDWKKYLKYAIPVIIIIGLLLWWKPWEPKPDNGAGDVVAAFTADKTKCEAPCEVSFENTSENAATNAATYEWNFGDGTTSAEANPSHTFDSAGNYTVKLMASKDGQVKEKTLAINVTEKPPVPSPVADFSSNKTECEAPCTLDFNNASQNADTYHWDFGDGTASTEANPSHAYKQPGDYTVKLIALKGSQQHEKANSIKITSQEENMAFAVTDVICRIKHHSGPLESLNLSAACPRTISFIGTITVNTAGTVQYSWTGETTGGPGPVHHVGIYKTLSFSEAGSQTVEISLNLKNTGRTNMQLRIKEPSEMVSNRAVLDLRCK